MKVFSLVAAAALLSSTALLAQAPGQGTSPGTTSGSQQPAEPGTGTSTVTPASKAPTPVQKPDLRLDSKPTTAISSTLDSTPTSQYSDLSLDPMDLGLGASPLVDLGFDIIPAVPAGMLSRSEPRNPSMVYYSLPVVAGNEIADADKAILDARHADLAHAAGSRGLDLNNSGFQPRQTICPATQPGINPAIGVPAAGNGQGFILLNFRRDDANANSRGFAAIVPRDASLPVRVIKDPGRRPEPKRNKKAKEHQILHSKQDTSFVNEALPPATLYADLQPVQDWIATSACIATMGGASPSIPNEPYLTAGNNNTISAPPPLIRLLRNGERKVTFTDRVDEGHFDIWDEHVSHRGKMLDAERQERQVRELAVTNPPVPPVHRRDNIPQPPSHITPEPPSPLSGDKQ